MKLLFDTNVVISGFVTRGYSFDVIKDAVYKHEVYYSEYLLKEIQEILPNKFTLSDSVTHFTISTIKRYFIKGKTAAVVENVCRDPKDNQVLADVLVNGIEMLITGDKDLLELKNYKGIKIISPRDYWHVV